MPAVKFAKKRGGKTCTKKKAGGTGGKGSPDSRYTVAADSFLKVIRDAATTAAARTAAPLFQEVQGKLNSSIQDQVRRGMQEGSYKEAIQNEVRRGFQEIRAEEDRQKREAAAEAEKKKNELLKIVKLVREELKGGGGGDTGSS